MSRQPSIALADQADRERFRTELERNFSVIAPAGVGKTTAIVARVAALAQADAHRADPVLPRLAVVTYTQKAAREIQERARARLLADGAGPEQLGRFSQAFFGTIHSLCLLVLKNFGHLVGLPSGLSQVDDIDTLWRRYLRATDTVLQHLPPHARERFMRHGSLTDALDLVPQLPTTLPPSPPLPHAPVPDISAILSAAEPKRADSRANIERGKQIARRWLDSFDNGNGHLPLPSYTKGGKAFAEAFASAFSPLCDWLGEATLTLARGVAEDFRRFRRDQGLLTFDDMIAWAAYILDHPEAAAHIQRRRWCLILDEAQDTDPLQFRILLGLSTDAEPTDAAGHCANDNDSDHMDATAADVSASSQPLPIPQILPIPQPSPSSGSMPIADSMSTADSTPTPAGAARHSSDFALPAPGRFCMVGDPQQSIYGGRADLATYRGVHQALVASGRGEALRFTVTMRCDHAIVDAANAVFPALLPRQHNAVDLALAQVEYVPLQARPGAGPGEVSRLPLETATATDSFADADTPDEAPDANTDGATDDSERAESGKAGRKDNDRAAARALAQTLAANGPEAFGETDWADIAILCPRNEPLGIIARALEAQGLPVQNHSRTDLRADSAAYAWLAALVRIFAWPEDAFEVAGVLREAFGLADGALYDYVQAAGYGNAHASERVAGGPGNWHPLALSASPLAGGGAVAEALALLRSVREKAVALPLREGAALMSRMLHLPERLASLGDGRASAYREELENLLLQAAACEEQGFDWQQWAHALYTGFTAKTEAPEPLRGHIQLLSCHKSKGLQWPVVILANLFRPVGYGKISYPRLLLPSRNEPPRVAFASIHGHDEAEQTLRLKDWHELQRLAYVACTRARRRMVWVDDSAFYEKPKNSFADALGLCDDGDNLSFWQTLPQWHASPGAASNGEPDDAASSSAAGTTKTAPDAHGENNASHTTDSDTADSDTAFAPGSKRTAARRNRTTPAASDQIEFELFTVSGAAVSLGNAASVRPAWGKAFAPPPQSAEAERERLLASAAAVIRRVLPSSLAHHEADGTGRRPNERNTTDILPDGSGDVSATGGHNRDEPDNRLTLPGFAELEASAVASGSSGAEYGNWWHAAMERAPWGQPAAQWAEYGTTELAHCPAPERGSREWALFTGSALFARLNQPQMVVRCELSLLWPDAEQSLAYDGFIDLVARDSASGQWLLIDWKTDRLAHRADPAAELLRCYGPQLDAYRRALEAMFSAPVQAHLYNTQGAFCTPPLGQQ